MGDVCTNVRVFDEGSTGVYASYASMQPRQYTNTPGRLGTPDLKWKVGIGRSVMET
jgi:hypothetical protein